MANAKDSRRVERMTKVIMKNTMQCEVYHHLKRITTKPAGYNGGWMCDVCGSILNNFTPNGVLHCPLCQYDRCDSCQQKVLRDASAEIAQLKNNILAATRPRVSASKTMIGAPDMVACFSKEYDYFRLLCDAAGPELADLEGLKELSSLLKI